VDRLLGSKFKWYPANLVAGKNVRGGLPRKRILGKMMVDSEDIGLEEVEAGLS
jgi:hypothetical protein